VNTLGKAVLALATLAVVATVGLGAASAAFATTPTIANLNPSAKAVGSSTFSMTVTGANFEPDAVVRWGSDVLTPSARSSTSLRVSVDGARVAAIGTANVSVRNVALNETSLASTFTIVKPTLSGVAPAAAANTSTALSFTLTGTGLSAVDSPSVRIKHGATVVGASAVVVQSSTTIVGRLNLATPATAPPGVYDVVLTYGSSGSITLPSAFTVTGPTLTSIAPATGANTSTGLAFTLSGTGLNGLASPAVAFRGTGANAATTISAFGLLPASGGLTMLGFVDLTSPTTAPPGVYDVVLTYGGGATVKLAAAFTVTGPTLTSITPVGGVNTSPALAFTLAGTHLNGLTTPAVQLKGTGLISGVTVRATALEASSSGLSMKGILDLAVPVVPAGTYDVVLTYGATASVKLAAAFAVANPIPVLTSIAPTTVYAGST